MFERLMIRGAALSEAAARRRNGEAAERLRAVLGKRAFASTFAAFFRLIHDLRAVFEGVTGDRAGPRLARTNDPFVGFVRDVLKLVDPHAVVLLDLEAVVAATLAERGPDARGDAR